MTMRGGIAGRFETRSPGIVAAFGGLLAVLAACALGAWLLPPAPGASSWPSAGLLIVEAGAAVLVGLRVVTIPRERFAWGVMCLALVVLVVRGVIEELGAVVAAVSAARVSLLLYVAFGGLAFVALAFIIRSRVTRVSVTVWLDGLIAALGLLAVVSYVTLTPGETFQGREVVELLYPSVPLLLAAILVAAAIALDRRPSIAWWLQLLAATLMTISTALSPPVTIDGSVVVGSTVGVLWALATLLIALAAWSSPAPPSATELSFRGIVVAPSVFSIAALVVLVLNEVREGGTVTEYLAFAALAAGIVRLLIAVAAAERLRRRERALVASLEIARDAALDAAAAKSTFLATMSHEIRTPLNAVLGMNELLLDTDIDATQRSYIEKASLSGSLLLELLTDILDFSKIEVGAIELERRAFDLERLVVASAHVLSFAAESKQLPVIVDYATDAPRHVLGDATRLRQVLVNLLGNAVKFTHEGDVRLSVSRGHEPGSVRFEVADTGIGIHPEQLAYLFEPFTQADQSTTRARGGTGLGLSICQSLVGLMGGRIEVDTAPGAGSRFVFEIVLEEVALDEGDHVADIADIADVPDITGAIDQTDSPDALLAGPAVRVEESGVDARAGSSSLSASSSVSVPSTVSAPSGGAPRRLKVLVAEDNPTLQFLSTRLVTKIGHVATTVANGADAVEAVSRETFDIVLMDVHMPTMDGLEAARRIRAAGPAVVQPRIIALTAGATTRDRDDCFEAGMDDYISKPFTSRDLEEAFLAVAMSVPEVPAAETVADVPRRVIDDLDPADRIEVLRTFVDGGRRDLDLLALALAGDATDDPRFVAHRLRGGSLSVGATELAEACLAVESTPTDGAVPPERLAHLRDSLATAVARIATELHAKHSP